MVAKKPSKKPGTAVVTLRMTKEFHKRLRIAAAHHEVTIQALVLKGAQMVMGDL